jgi:hypothetical protein
MPVAIADDDFPLVIHAAVFAFVARTDYFKPIVIAHAESAACGRFLSVSFLVAVLSIPECIVIG